MVPGDQLGDVRRHSVHDRVGDEDPAEVVRGESQWPAAGVGHAGAVQGVVDELADGRAADRAGLAAEAALEQQRYRRVPYAFVVVVGHGQRHGAVLAADPADDGGEYVGELGPDDQEPFDVGLGRGNVQQRDQLAAGWQAVLDQAVMGQLGEFLDPDAGIAQDVHGGPGPERLVFFEGQVAALAGAGVLGPGLSRRCVGGLQPGQCLACGGELPAGGGGPGGLQPLGGGGVAVVDGGQQDGQDRHAFAGALIHP